MNVPKGLMYSKSHEWVKFNDDGSAIIGLTDHAQDSLSDVVFVNLCEDGDNFSAGDVIGDVESIKAVSEINTPVNGIVVKVNDEVLDSPELINSAPYDTWLIELSGVTDKSALISPEEYEVFIKEA